MTYNYRQINYEVMSDTAQRCSADPELANAISHSTAFASALR